MQEPVKEITIFPNKTFPLNMFFLPAANQPFIRLHWHPHIEWVYMLSGTARVQIDATFTDVKQGDLIFVNSNQVHGATPLQDNTRAVAIVTNEALIRNSFLDSTEAQYILPLLKRDITLPNFSDSSDPTTIEIRNMIEELIQEFLNKKAGHELIIKSKLYSILGLMIRHFHQVTDQKSASPNGKTAISEEFRILLQYLEKHCNQNISINDAAKMINVSPSHFYRLFKKITGKTFVEYVNILRIFKAESLLSDINLTVTEIAGEVGFGSITYFGRVFRDIKNISPTEYRKHIQKGSLALSSES